MPGEVLRRAGRDPLGEKPPCGQATYQSSRSCSHRASSWCCRPPADCSHEGSQRLCHQPLVLLSCLHQVPVAHRGSDHPCAGSHHHPTPPHPSPLGFHLPLGPRVIGKGGQHSAGSPKNQQEKEPGSLLVMPGVALHERSISLQAAFDGTEMHPDAGLGSEAISQGKGTRTYKRTP